MVVALDKAMGVTLAEVERMPTVQIYRALIIGGWLARCAYRDDLAALAEGAARGR